MSGDNRGSPSWEELQAQKDELFEKAKIGEITGEEADAEAIRLGLGSLSRQPSSSEFRPESEAQWTLPMAVAWIAYRDFEEVREAWPAYCAECWYWFWERWRNGPGGEIQEGWILKQRHFPTLTHIEMRAIVDRADNGTEKGLMTIREAREALWAALGEGMLPATGVPRLGGGRQQIPAQDWLALLPLDKHERDELGRAGVGMDYADPLVPSQGVRHLWGPRKEQLILPPLMTAEGDGYMPLYCAARWIASKGGALDFDPEDSEIWRTAYDALLGAMASEKVRVSGLRGGARELVPGYRFAGCEIDYPHTEAPSDIFLSEQVYLRSYPYLDDEHWRHGFDDALVSRQADHYTQLMVEKGDVRARWPFETENADEAPLTTGLPGRPGKAKHLIEDELQRRAANRKLESSLSGEAQALLNWLILSHPAVPRPTVKTIKNNIRDTFRNMKSGTK